MNDPATARRLGPPAPEVPGRRGLRRAVRTERHAGRIFLPTRDARAVGATIRFEIALLDDTVVFAGEGVVTWAKPKGMGVKFTTLDPCDRADAGAASESARGRSSRAGKPRRRAQPGHGASRRPPARGPATDRSPLSIEPRTRRPLIRVALVCSAVFAGVAVVWMSIGRARVRTGSPSRAPRSRRPSRSPRAPPPHPPRNRHAATAGGVAVTSTRAADRSASREPPPTTRRATPLPRPGRRALRRPSRREDARRHLLQELHLS